MIDSCDLRAEAKRAVDRAARLEEALVCRMLAAWDFEAWGEAAIVSRPVHYDRLDKASCYNWRSPILGLTRAGDHSAVIRVHVGDHLDESGPEMSATEGAVRVLYARRGLKQPKRKYRLTPLDSVSYKTQTRAGSD